MNSTEPKYGYERNHINPGDRFGRLTVVRFDEASSEFIVQNSGRRRYIKKYLCRCDCGNEKLVAKDLLTRKNGGVRSCGCAMHRHIKGDLTGLVVNNLRVLYRDVDAQNGGGKHSYWVCKCLLCGEKKSIRSSYLRDGSAQDCGCGKCERLSAAQRKNLDGMVFGHLHVIERDASAGYNSGAHTRWLCKCDLCGNIESVASDMLTSYGKDRCARCNSGMSIGEARIAEILESNNISYRHDTSIGCRNPETGYQLQFDFVINDCDGSNLYIVEFDGEQHFKKAPLAWERTTPLEKRQRYDRYKSQWCADNGIPLIRIPYTHLNKLCFDDLVPSTTAFLV